MKATPQSILHALAAKHPPPQGFDFCLGKRSAADALEYGGDLRALDDACATHGEFADCLSQMLLSASKAVLLMNLSRRLAFMERQLCDAGFYTAQLVELLALDDQALAYFASGLEVHGVTLATLVIMRPLQIRALLHQGKPNMVELTMAEELLLSHYRLCSRNSRKAIWRAARLMARSAAGSA